MVWAKIKRIENSKYNNSNIVYFDFLKKEVFCIVSDNVLKYLKITEDELYNAKEIFVIKSFNKNNRVIYLIKSIK